MHMHTHMHMHMHMSMHMSMHMHLQLGGDAVELVELAAGYHHVALRTRDGAVLVPFADACAAPPRGLFVVALEALATFSQIGLDDDARADLARACAQLVRHTLPACRRSPAVQAVLADHLPRAATALLRGGAPEAEALLRCLIEVMWVPSQGDEALVEELRRVAPATPLGGVAAQLLAGR